ncbi:hypothetical protein FJ366_01555 [Candidatus Dependentiae bacterium]|nr:hypothetical protein [Candidatus Dependentiae bacterium]
MPLFVFQEDKSFRDKLSPNQGKSLTAFYSFLSSSIFIRLLNDGLSKNTLLNIPKDFLLSLNITHKSNKWINALNGLKFLYLANKIQTLINDIENECTELSIESEHSTGAITQDPNNLILPSTGFLISSAMSWFAEPINPLINIKVPCIPFIIDNETVIISVNLLRIICFAAKTFFLFKKNFIPFSTIQKLSPELQERCYDVRMETLSLCNIFSMYPMTPIKFGRKNNYSSN